ncbi:DUF4333 domain-containing protein [Streptomyces sp. NBC_00525]|uniref:DUF4333 domain-containing protein n=1 Tax=Streptomyces sp. NBC_00525 TaxID=2903660 RepID=UPI002E80223B|nr:DUF4333 domain-containing protein [Streptomyces sp. NBC_00525]WUC94218.1 DUF4333 domain-containing protein [Streptomyces sp. NBC_00525]
MRKSVRRGRGLAAVSAGTLALFLVSGCSFSFGGDKVVKKDEVAEQASAGLEKQVGRAPEDVTCEDDLKAEVGASVRCTLTDGGKKLGMTVTVRSVDGDDVKMDYKVDGGADSGASADPQPSGSPSGATGTAGAVDKAEVARQGRAALAAQVGKEPDTFTCPQDLPARVGAMVRCRLTDGGSQYGVTVTAQSISGGTVHMDFKVDQTAGG